MHTQQAKAEGATPPAWKPCTGNQHSKNRPRSSALPSTDTRVQEAVHRYSGRASRWPSASRKPTRAGISGQLCCLRGQSSNPRIHDPWSQPRTPNGIKTVEAQPTLFSIWDDQYMRNERVSIRTCDTSSSTECYTGILSNNLNRSCSRHNCWKEWNWYLSVRLSVSVESTFDRLGRSPVVIKSGGHIWRAHPFDYNTLIWSDCSDEYSFIRLLNHKWLTAHAYNQSTGYTKYGPPAKHAG